MNVFEDKNLRKLFVPQNRISWQQVLPFTRPYLHYTSITYLFSKNNSINFISRDSRSTASTFLLSNKESNSVSLITRKSLTTSNTFLLSNRNSISNRIFTRSYVPQQERGRLNILVQKETFSKTI
jgi:hypothetical protein